MTENNKKKSYVSLKRLGNTETKNFQGKNVLFEKKEIFLCDWKRRTSSQFTLTNIVTSTVKPSDICWFLQTSFLRRVKKTYTSISTPCRRKKKQNVDVKALNYEYKCRLSQLL